MSRRTDPARRGSTRSSVTSGGIAYAARREGHISPRPAVGNRRCGEPSAAAPGDVGDGSRKVLPPYQPRPRLPILRDYLFDPDAAASQLGEERAVETSPDAVLGRKDASLADPFLREEPGGDRHGVAGHPHHSRDSVLRLTLVPQEMLHLHRLAALGPLHGVVHDADVTLPLPCPQSGNERREEEIPRNHVGSVDLDGVEVEKTALLERLNALPMTRPSDRLLREVAEPRPRVEEARHAGGDRALEGLALPESLEAEPFSIRAGLHLDHLAVLSHEQADHVLAE